jgi:uncharacterized protein involved in exopolysaccharide biosynthesis
VKRTYLELFFRHRLLLTAPLLIALVAGVGWGLTRDRTYKATASVWTDAPIPNDSTVGTRPVNDTTPSAGQQELLTELLATRTFQLSVANDSPMAKDLQGRSATDVESALNGMAGKIEVSTAGPQVVTVSVKDTDPQMATGISSSLVKQFIAAETDRIQRRVNAQLTYDKQQLTESAEALSTAQAALARYTRAHPDAGASDGTITQLTAAVTTAQQQNATAAEAVTKDNALLAHVADNSVLEVIDQPTSAYPQSRMKPLVIGGIGGLLAGGTLVIVALLVLMARDNNVRQESELEAQALTVVGSIGELPGRRRARQRQRRGDEHRQSEVAHAARDSEQESSQSLPSSARTSQ